jgi:hypothetical protein
MNYKATIIEDEHVTLNDELRDDHGREKTEAKTIREKPKQIDKARDTSEIAKDITKI